MNPRPQMSWTFVNDSLCTTLCLQWEPEVLTISIKTLIIKIIKAVQMMVTLARR